MKRDSITVGSIESPLVMKRFSYPNLSLYSGIENRLRSLSAETNEENPIVKAKTKSFSGQSSTMNWL